VKHELYGHVLEAPHLRVHALIGPYSEMQSGITIGGNVENMEKFCTFFINQLDDYFGQEVRS